MWMLDVKFRILKIITFALRYLHRITSKPDSLYRLFANRMGTTLCWVSRLAGDLAGSVLSAGLTGLASEQGICSSVCSSPASRTAGHLQVCAKIIQTACKRQKLHVPQIWQHQRGNRAAFIWANRAHIHTTEVTICTKNGAAEHNVQSIYSIK